MSEVQMAWMPGLLSYFVVPMLVLGIALATVRLMRGPELNDRVLALDLIGMLGIGVAITYAILTGRMELLDVAMVLAVLAFLSTLAYAVHMQRRNQSWS